MFKNFKFKNNPKNILLFLTLVIAFLLLGSTFLINKGFNPLSLASKSQNEFTKNLPIAMALDDGYTYPTIVAITSAMENSNSQSTYEFYIMHPGDFKEENKEKLLTLQKKYKNCTINLIDMENQFKNANDKGHITTPAYYRLALSGLLPDLDKIIWMDGDTLTFYDLTEMFNIDINGYYYKGFLDNNKDGIQRMKEFGINDDFYICSGVMLVNLDELRKNNMEDKFNKFIEENNDRLIQHDQTVINTMCHGKIGILPPKFGIYNMCNEDAVKSYNNKLDASIRYNEEEMLKAYKDPTIIHCVAKPWKDQTVAFTLKWREYARLTPFYKEIIDEYKL